VRWDLPLPSRADSLAYMREVRDRVVDRLRRGDSDPRLLYLAQYTVFHEDMHDEAFTYTRQTLGYPAPPGQAVRSGAAAGPVEGDVPVPGGEFVLGADPGEPFVFDNEKWGHEVEIEPFRISATPVTNAEYQAFVDDRGYARRELWNRRAWNWRRRAGAEHPLFWVKADGLWHERRFDAVVPLAPWHPVSQVCWYEAEAYCRWARRRLPTEAEWEMAASLDVSIGRKRRFPWGDEPPNAERANLDYRAGGPIDVRALPAGDSAAGCRQMIGNVWEWVDDTFQPYPGFVCDPYKEYSLPYFGTKKVLRGGAWATRSSLIRNTWRNFYMRHRRNIFAGFRTVAL